MIGGIRFRQTREFILVRFPVKVAAVHNHAAHGGGMAVHVLGGGVGHDVRTPLEGPAVHRGGEGVVDDEGHAVGVGRLGELLNIQDGEGGVCNGLAEHRLGVGPEGGVQLLLGAVRVHEGELDAHALHGDGEQVEGTAVDGGGGRSEEHTSELQSQN